MIVLTGFIQKDFDAVLNARLIAADFRADVKTSQDGLFEDGSYPDYFNDALLEAAEALEKLDVARIKATKEFAEQNKG